MARNEQAPGKARGDVEVTDLDYSEEEYTSPGVDPKVAEAMESLKRVQQRTTVRVSDICEILSKRSSSNPPPK